jgi:hypothetical protein
MRNDDLERVNTPFGSDSGTGGYPIEGAIPQLLHNDTEDEETEVAVVIAVIREHIGKTE